MKAILLPTDLTHTSELALSYAVSLAKQQQAALEVLHVEPKVNLSVARPIRHWERGTHGAFAPEEWKYWQQEVIRRVVASGREIPVHFVQGRGAPIERIVTHAREKQIDWIVMGTSQDGTARPHKPLGSVALGVLKEVSCPVLLVPANARGNPIRHLAYASDFRETSLDAVLDLVPLVKSLNGALTVVHVRGQEEFWDQTQQDFFDRLYRLSENSPHVSLKVLRQDNIEAALTDFVHKEQVDALGLLHRHHHSMQEYYQNSLTRRVAQKSEVPMIVFHGE